MRPAPTWCQQAGRRVGPASPPAPSVPKPRHQSGCSVVELGVSGGLPLPPHLPLACSPEPPSPPLQPSRRRATHHFSVAEPEPPRSQSPRAVATQGCSRSGQGAQSAPPGGGYPRGHAGRTHGCVCFHACVQTQFACPDLFTRARRNWLAWLNTSAPPSHLPSPLPPTSLPPAHTSKEIRNVTTNSSCRKPATSHAHSAGGGGGPRRGGVIGEPEVNEIIGKVRCEFVTEV